VTVGPSGYRDHTPQFGTQVCGAERADGRFEFLLRPPPVRCGVLETGLARRGERYAACAAIGPGPDFYQSVALKRADGAAERLQIGCSQGSLLFGPTVPRCRVLMPRVEGHYA